MKTLFILLNHKLNEAQLADAKASLKIGEFVDITSDLWANIPPESPSIDNLLSEFKQTLQHKAQQGDYLLVQGDFGATYIMIEFARKLGIIPIYATTTRSVNDSGGRVFTHCRFREYGV